MEHYFELPVTINGEELSFKGRMATFCYVYKFYIIVDGQELVFEKDDEQQYRVLSERSTEAKAVDPNLIQLIINALDKLSKT